MYGTIARLKVKPGHVEALKAQQSSQDWPPGGLVEYLYQMDDDPNEVYLVVAFEDKEAYFANADRPEMHQEYLKMMEHLDGEPEWHDGEIIFSASR